MQPLKSFVDSLKTAWSIPALQARIKFVLFAFAIQVFAIHVPVPGIDAGAMERLFNTAFGSALGLIDLFSGGALKSFSIVAMGILPYINASIIMQLLGVAIPELEKKIKEGGESGRREINKYTRYLTLALSLFQSFLLVTTLQSEAGLGLTVVGRIQTMVSLTAGTMFLVWLGDRITEKGIGNGISLIIFGNIMISLPHSFAGIYELTRSGSISVFQVIMMVAAFILTVAGVTAMVQAERKIPVQHARRVVGGGKVTAGGSTYLPIKVNSAGVMPIIFAMAALAIPNTIGGFAGNTWLGNISRGISTFLTPSFTLGGMTASLIYTVVIVFFTFFYTVVVMDIPQMSENLKKWNAFVPGIRPGKETTSYLDRVISRVTFAGAIFLAVIALAQFLMPALLGISGNVFPLYGGTSLLIVVGVALETMKAIEAQLMMRHYEGFIK